MKEFYKDIFTDGSCRLNGQKGAIAGWAYACLDPFICASGIVPVKKHSVNTAELWAIHEAIRRFGEDGGVIRTDSDYCVGVLSKSWNVQQNSDIVKSIKLLPHFDKFRFMWVSGHSGVWGNELVNKMAMMQTKNLFKLSDHHEERENHEKPFWSKTRKVDPNDDILPPIKPFRTYP